MRRALPALAVLMCVPRVGWADSGPLPLELTWEAPESCPNAASVVHRVEQIVRGPPLARSAVVAKAKIQSEAGGRFHLALTLRTGDVEETKTIGAASCASLAEASAVVIALAIDPTSNAPADEEEEIAASEAPAPPAPPPPAKERRRRRMPPPPTPPPSRFVPGAFATVTTGTLPEPSVGLGLSATLRLHRFRVGLLGALALRQSPTFDKTAGASFDMVEAGAYGAYLVPLGQVVAVGPCANVEATYVHVRSFGIRDPRTTSTLWPTLVLGSRVEARMTRWLGLFARADLPFPIGAPQFTLSTSGDLVRLHQPNAPALRLTLGVEIVLP